MASDRELQHDQWIGEVRSRDLGHRLAPAPESPRLTVLDGYTILQP